MLHATDILNLSSDCNVAHIAYGSFEQLSMTMTMNDDWCTGLANMHFNYRIGL